MTQNSQASVQIMQQTVKTDNNGKQYSKQYTQNSYGLFTLNN